MDILGGLEDVSEQLEKAIKEQRSSIGSGSIESGIKQIGIRVKKTGSQWKKENVNKILSLRCGYLNGVLSQ